MLRSNHLTQSILIALVLLAGLACGQGTSVDVDFEDLAAEWGNPTSGLPSLAVNELAPGQEAFAFTTNSGEQVSYWLSIPEGFDASQLWPLIVYLHGSNGVGSDIERIRNVTPPIVRGGESDLPFIVVSPQNPEGIWPEYIDEMDQLVQYLLAELPVDPERVILSGLSDGGYGTWNYALRYPERFDAIVPISYGPVLRPDDPMPDLCALNGVAIWIFHSENDAVIPIEPNYAAVEALEACGNEQVRFTVYPRAGHGGAWLKAYRDERLYRWMLNLPE